mmetsp:Transcript_23090/g.52382  ORF Transcript_23090/g.52382 Transcript_23090/m.52382 type:complete len:111 (+) Transcript_23090:1240-1572(+)
MCDKARKKVSQPSQPMECAAAERCSHLRRLQSPSGRSLSGVGDEGDALKKLRAISKHRRSDLWWLVLRVDPRTHHRRCPSSPTPTQAPPLSHTPDTRMLLVSWRGCGQGY